MVVAPRSDARTRLGLLLRQDGQEAEDQRHPRVELHAHQTLRDGFGNVLEVHSLALDQHADGDDSIKRRGGCPCGSGGQGGQVGGAGAEQVSGAEGGRGCGLDLRGGVEFGAGDGEFPGPGDGLHHDIGLFDARGEEFCFCAGDERFDYCRVPAGMDDANTQGAAIVLLSLTGAFEGRGHDSVLICAVGSMVVIVCGE